MPFINGIGPGELIIILIIALIVVGPGKLPDVGASLGKSIREFRKAATDVKESASLDPVPAPAVPAATPAPVAIPPAPVVAAPAAAVVADSAMPPAPVVAAPVGAAGAVAVEAPPAAEAAPSAVPGTPADAASSEWPAEVVPVDEQRPTASA